ncbi:MAG: DNA adenine methylase [Treponema sp.]|nr:DNA adenine methylase [Treponema sp.]
MSGQSARHGTNGKNAISENREYLTKQLVTYIGNKRALLKFIGKGIEIVQKKLGKEKLKMFDVFSGSGIAARYFKQFADLLVANDLEKYSSLINECYLSNKSDLDFNCLRDSYHYLLDEAGKNLRSGMIRELYAPADENNIQENDRVFYTVRNAQYIDTIRQLINEIPEKFQKYFISPLLSEASIHANTSGVFKGFYKNKQTGIGQFGGSNQDALFRITGDIHLPFPVFSNFETETIICNGDANEIIKTVPEVDFAYLDTPYNQHPYGANYFMLNLILDYKHPENISKVSGIPDNWNRSEYNKEHYALSTLSDLVYTIKSKFVLISFNSDGFIKPDDMKTMLGKIGKPDIIETRYNTFRGSRNLKERDIHVKEYLYLVEK